MIQANTKRAGRYVLCFSGDPALQFPEAEDERDRALTTARETGKWSAHTKDGQQPTFFHMRALGRDEFGAWKTWRDPNGNSMAGTNAGWMALARLALDKVENFEGRKVESVKDKYFGTLASLDLFEDVEPALVDAILIELGVAVFEHEQVTRGK